MNYFKVGWLSLFFIASQSLADTNDWPSYAGDAGGLHYSALQSITPTNVKNLKPAWIFHTGDFLPAKNGHNQTAFEATPILFHDTLYFCTPFSRVIALNAETGKALWQYDPQINKQTDYAGPLRCRGVASWEDTSKPIGSFCQQRIFATILDGRLVALDAKTGKPCPNFANNGSLFFNTITKNNLPLLNSSPPAIYQNNVIVGSTINDNQRTNSPHGIVRAFDAQSGKLRWQWDPVPTQLAEKTGAMNAWAPLSVDNERGIVFIPTSSPSPDYYGGNRLGANPYENAVIALRASDGKLLWHFQTVHHNLWDYDLPSQPTLVTVNQIPAVLQTTKTGFIFLLNRLTGQPLFPIVERPVPASTVPGEITSPTQPFPTLPAALVPQTMPSQQAWGLTFADRAWCRLKINKLANEGIFTPPALKGLFEIPGATGGNNWGGGAFDPKSGVFIVNSTNLAYFIHLIPRDDYRKVKLENPNAEVSPQTGTPYALMRAAALSPLGVPCNPPPWGTLAAIDMKNGKILWQVPFGTVKKGIFYTPKKWGAPNIGGPLLTASGIIFIGATPDRRFHAYAADSGRLIWQYDLPADGIATPMTYQIHGKQYVVIAAGGGRISNHASDALIAFRLP